MGKVHHSAVAISAAMLLVTFLSPAADKLWTGAVSSDWFESNNWDPPGVPFGSDAALIATNGATLSADVFVRHLVLGNNASISGPGNLTATNLTCTNAWLRAGGGVFIPTGGVFRVESGRSFLECHLHNDGHVIVTASNASIFINGLHNVFNRGTFEIQGDISIDGAPWDHFFVNTGLFLKSAGERTNAFGIPFINRGEMRVLSGALRLIQRHTNEGTLEISERATVEITGLSMIGPAGSLRGLGTLRFVGGFPGTIVLTTNSIQPRIEILNSSSPPGGIGTTTLTFDSAVSVRECLLDGGSISGTNTVTITNLLWAKGWLQGPGTLVIPAGGSMMVTGVFSQYHFPKYVSGRTLINYGDIEWRDSGTIDRLWTDPGLLLNRGRFRVSGDGEWRWESINEGVVVRSNGTGLCQINLTANSSLVEVQSGTLAASYVQSAGETYLNGGNLYVGSQGLRLLGGIFRGSGSVYTDPPASDAYHAIESSTSELHPGNPFGVLTVQGHCHLGSTTRVVIEIAGVNPGIDHDQLVMTRKAWVESAALSVVLRNGFKPMLGDRFEIARFPNQSSWLSTPTSFSRISGSDLGDGLILLPEYSSTNLVLVVTNSPANPFYVAKNASGPWSRHVRFHGSPARNYVLQGSTTLTNWIDLFPANGSIDLIDYREPITWSYHHRFYRVRWGE